MPPRGDSRLKTPLIAGNYLHLINYNVTGNGGRECLKIIRFVQSAAKIHHSPNKYISCWEEYRFLDEYVDNKTNIRFKCKTRGHISLSRPGNKKIGHGCIKCAGVKPYTLEEIRQKVTSVTDGEYEYLDDFYINSIHHHTIKHLECGHIWKPTMNMFLGGTRCPNCSNIYNSKGVRKIKRFLERNNISYLTEYKVDGLISPFGGESLRFDFYLPDKEVYIEFDGEQHFIPFRYKNGKEKFERTKKLDSIKNNFCKDRNLNLLRIPYTEESNIDEILSDKILSLSE